MEEMKENEVQEQEELVPIRNDEEPEGSLYVAIVIAVLIAAFVWGVVIA